MTLTFFKTSSATNASHIANSSFESVHPNSRFGTAYPNIDLDAEYSSLGKTEKTKPAITKPWFSWPDALVTMIAISCCSLASAVVANNNLAWKLGLTYQLVVVGFLLSIMNLCLTFIAPTFFLLCEARYGRSILQNYDAILRNGPLLSNVSWTWRTILLLLTVLPLGISAGYKLFTGGVSTNTIEAGHPLYSDKFGMYAPPGLQEISQPTGTSLMFNATMPFIQATSTNATALAANISFGDPKWDPPLPQYPQAYGFNTLLLNDNSTAILDVPHPDWLSKVQSALEAGESWNITATVAATVSLSNTTINHHRNLSSPFWTPYTDQGSFSSIVLYNGFNIGLFANHYGPDESWCFIGIYPDPGGSFDSFLPHAKLYNLLRTTCTGTWILTRASFELLDGACDLGPHFPNTHHRDQAILTNNSLTLADFYMPTLMELLAPFATDRNASHWRNPSFSTAVAAMVWSKATSVAGPGRRDFDTRKGGRFVRADLRYRAEGVEIFSARPTLRRSWALLGLFFLQPLLILGICGAGWTLREVPIRREFGLLDVLAGIEVGSLGVLRRLGGKERVRLDVRRGEGGRLVYCVGVDDGRRRRGGGEGGCC